MATAPSEGTSGPGTLTDVPPSELEPSRCHVRRTHEPPTSQLVRSIEQAGFLRPLVLIGRYEDGGVRLVDGVRRAKAASEAGVESVPVLVRDLDDTDARAQSLTLNARPGTANNKQVSDTDRERALQTLMEWKDTDRTTVEFELGLLSEADRIERALANVTGVGRTTAERLADHWSLPCLKSGNVNLQTVDGIGKKRAAAIRAALQD